MPTQLPPITGNNELDQFNYDVSQALASNVGGGGTSDVTVSTDDQDRPVIGGLTLGYQDRYLETAYGTSANGANFSQTVGGLPAGSTTIYQGVRNQTTNAASSNPADYTWRLITGPVNSDTLVAAYRLTGGRRILWSFATSLPADFILDSGAVIDLDGFEGGDDAVLPRINSLRLPAAMTTAQVITAYDAQTLDYATFRPSEDGLQFRDNMGEAKVLLSTIQIGGVDSTATTHYGYTYLWMKNGASFTPSIAGQNLTRRFIVINADDVNDGGEDVFSCQVIQA